jgi:uncharacterized membrane protein YkvA (DUF1232 family)
MNNSHLLILLQEAKISPETLAKYMGISNMTIRRLLKKSPQAKLSKIYNNALATVIYEFLAKGIISSESKSAVEAIKEQSPVYFDAAARNLEIPEDFKLFDNHPNQERIMFWLSRIGSDKARETDVENNLKKISLFKKWGKDWSFRITALLRAIHSREYPLFKKCVAYGALFYLICLFDLIPDTIPVIGYLDDFLICGLAVAYLSGGAKIKKYS